MATPKTEVILAPTVSRSDLNEVKTRMNQAFEDVSRKSQKELERGTKKGVSDGIKKGGDDGVKFLKKGLIGVAGAVGTAALNAMMGADEVVSRMVSRLEGVRDITKEAGAFGVSSGELAQTSAIFTALGYDQSDVRGLLSGFQAEINAPEMANFKEIADQSGIVQAMFSFIESTKNLSQTERAGVLQPVFGDEDTVIASALLSSFGGAGSLQELFNQITGENITANQLTRAIGRGEAESLELSKYTSAKYIQDLIKGGDAGQVIESMNIDRRVNAAHDRNIENKLEFKNLTATIEVASIDAANATVTGFEDFYLKNAKAVFSDLGGSIEKTKELGVSGVLGYQPFSTEPDRQKDPLLDTLLRGPFWDWLESMKTDQDKQDYTNPRY